MKRDSHYFFKLSYILCTLILISNSGCADTNSESGSKAEQAVLQVHRDYVQGWLQMDKEKILGLLQEDARLQPSGMKPVDGISEIQEFWFPNDSSVTTVNKFETEIISMKIIDTLAVSTHSSILDWNYQKDTISFGMLQKGINTTIYRKQSDDSWKIWRSMWTDFYFEPK